MMQNKMQLGIFPALSGVLTGIIAVFAVRHLNDNSLNSAGINFPAMLFYPVIFSVIFTAAWFYLSRLFASVFKGNIENEYGINAVIFSAGIPASFMIPVIMRYYGSLAAYSLKVVGNIYIPFKHYMHVNFAGYCFFLLIGFIIVFISFAVAIRFCFMMFKTGLPFHENSRIKSLFLVFFVFYAVVTSYVTLVYPPTGDEPHYILMAKSIAEDFDLDLTNNYADVKSIGEYYPAALDWKNIHNTAGKNNKGTYSIHSPGLPAMISVIFRFTGRYGVQLFMNALTALFIAVLYMLLITGGFSGKISMACASIAGFTIPVAADSSLVLTEIPAVLMITAALLMLARRKTHKNMLMFFMIMGVLPFFHTKLILISVMFYLYYYWLAIREKEFNLKKEAFNNIPVIMLAGLMIYFYYAIYGKFAIFAITSIYVSSSCFFIFSLPYAIMSFFGILFDRDFGLITYNWFMIVPLYGIIMAVIRKESKVLAPVLIFMPYTVMFLFMNNWGGSMTPARQLIPVIPALVIAAAYFIENTGFIKTGLFKFLASISVFISFLLMVLPVFRYGSGKEKIYAVISAKAPALMWIFPSFSAIITPVYFMTAVYVLIITVLFFRYKSFKNPDKSSI
jgi:hypothetical protein